MIDSYVLSLLSCSWLFFSLECCSSQVYGDEAGNFLIDVLVVALQSIHLQCMRLTLNVLDSAHDPSADVAFLVHTGAYHYYAIRQLNGHFYTIDSVNFFDGPVRIVGDIR